MLYPVAAGISRVAKASEGPGRLTVNLQELISKFKTNDVGQKSHQWSDGKNAYAIPSNGVILNLTTNCKV